MPRMSLSKDRLRRLLRFVLVATDVVMAVALVATGALIWLERGWVVTKVRDPALAFREGSIGTELLPLPVAEVLPELFPELFNPLRSDGSRCQGWIACFGFIPASNASVSDGLPVGFTISNYRPQSGAPSPVAFVGFGCALCHTTELRTEANGKPIILAGPGSASLNLFAWLDAFQAALLERNPPPKGEPVDPAHPPSFRLTVSMIADAYRTKEKKALGLAERTMVWLWLSQIRERFEEGLPRFDEPFGKGLSRMAEYVPTGPSRTQPFRTLIRQVLDRPGDDMTVYTKIATVFSEDLRKSAQFDGSITDLDARSSLAALAAGATVVNMALPEVADNIRKASDFTRTLRPPRFADLF